MTDDDAVKGRAAIETQAFFERSSLPISLLRARSLVAAQYRDPIRAADLTEQQFRVLRALTIEDGVSVRVLAARTDLLAPSLSRIVRDLSGRGLLEKIGSTVDRRRARLRVTLAGRELVLSIMHDVERIHSRLDGLVGHADVKELKRLLALLIVKLL